MFKGSMVALVTPFKNQKIDEAALRKLVNFHIDAGTHALVVAGTTGESGTLSHQEKNQAIGIVVDEARERIPVIAGTAMNATQACIEMTIEAMELGADAALIMTPAYIKPTQEGLYQHYHAIAEQAALPIILYNVPGRTACDLLPETVGRLSHVSNIIGIKEATGTLERLKALLAACEGRLDIFSGDDPTAASWMLSGAKGVISVTANVAPKWMAKLAEAALDGEQAKCLEIDEKLNGLHQQLFLESNPIPVKWVVSQMNLSSEEIRLPLTQLAEPHQKTLLETVRKLEIL